MKKTIAILILPLAACGGNTNALDARIATLERQVSALSAARGSASADGGDGDLRAAVSRLERNEADTWWCPKSDTYGRSMACLLASPEACRNAAAASFGGCVPTRAVACRSYDSGGPRGCFLSWGDCTGDYDADGNNFTPGRRPCRAFIGRRPM